jgi:hypothetical protein
MGLGRSLSTRFSVRQIEATSNRECGTETVIGGGSGELLGGNL